MATLRQRTAAFALALFLLAGCAQPTSPPGEQSAPSQQPRAGLPLGETAAKDGCGRESGDPPVGMVNSAYVRQGLCPAYVHTDPARVTFRLPAGVSEPAVRQSLTVTGPAPDKVQVTFNRTRRETVLSVVLPEGKAGDAVTVRLAGPVGVGGAAVEMGFQLTRVETPRIFTEVQVGDEPFKPLEPGATLPRQPLRFRFTLAGQPRRDRVEAVIQEALRQKGVLTPYTTTWEGESRLVVTVQEPPPAIFFPFDWLEAEHGLQVQRSSVALYTGEAPRLVAFDPVSWQETVVGEVPVDVLHASLSPDGAWAALIALAPDAAYREQVWVVNTRTGQRWLTGFQSLQWYRTVHWLPGGRMLLPTYRAVQVWDLAAAEGKRLESEATYWGPLSPDKRYLAGTAIDPLKVDESRLTTPGSVVLLDTQRMDFRLLPDIALARVRRSEVPTALPMAWDGGRLLVQDIITPHASQQMDVTRWRVIDPASGQVSDDKRASPPKEPPVGWPAQASGWQYKPNLNWGEVLLRSPEGQERSAGQGLVVGWRDDRRLLLIRWANFPYMRPTGDL